jgi:predicted DNA binding protein
MAPKKREVHLFFKCLCNCYIRTLSLLKSSENVYVNVTRWHQGSEKWIYFSNVCVIVTYELCFYWKVLKMFKFRKCLCKCHMIAPKKREMMDLLFKCLCNCYIRTLSLLKSSENVYVNVTRWHQRSEKWIYFSNVCVIVTYEPCHYWKSLKMFM